MHVPGPLVRALFGEVAGGPAPAHGRKETEHFFALRLFLPSRAASSIAEHLGLTTIRPAGISQSSWRKHQSSSAGVGADQGSAAAREPPNLPEVRSHVVDLSVRQQCA